MMFFTTVSLALVFASLGAFGYPFNVHRIRDSSLQAQNGRTAQQQNDQFKSLTPSSTCTEGENACVNDMFAQCVNGAFVLQTCGSGEICASLPLVNSEGTSITCTTPSDRDQRIQNALSNGSGNVSSAAASTATKKSAATSTTATASSSSTVSSSSGDLQSSTTLDPSLIAPNFAQDGQNTNGSEAGQVASLTSKNNFINFCATTKLPITNGQQIKTGSCNPAPMGMIAAQTKMPACKFVHPKNMDTLPAQTSFVVQMAVKNLETGNFVNAQSNYYSAPQQLNNAGAVIGHSHFVIEQLNSLDQTTPLDNTKFAFFQGVNTQADKNGILSVNVTAGRPAGYYRLASINSAANHQPVLVAVAQHGSLDDMVYFTVKNGAQ